MRSLPVLPPVGMEMGTLSFELVTLQLVLLSAVLIQHISIPSKLIVRRLDSTSKLAHKLEEVTKLVALVYTSFTS